tara:strand:- start:388 stop:792 length:405 start_codon:yes stop_codon:yes gene_type:complete
MNRRLLPAVIIAFVTPFSVSANDIIASSISLPTLSVTNDKQLEMSLTGIKCGVEPYFVDSSSVSILVNGTPLEFSRTCHDDVLSFKPKNRAENELFAELIVENRNVNLRYMTGARSYVYNDWQLGPVKRALTSK